MDAQAATNEAQNLANETGKRAVVFGNRNDDSKFDYCASVEVPFFLGADHYILYNIYPENMIRK